MPLDGEVVRENVGFEGGQILWVVANGEGLGSDPNVKGFAIYCSTKENYRSEGREWVGQILNLRDWSI